MNTSKEITINTSIKSDIDTVWKLWTTPKHIKLWNTASPDWHTKNVENDLRIGGRFSYRMEAKDGSMGFDFGGRYIVVKTNKQIDYSLDDGRKVSITFSKVNDGISITETFEPETQNPVDAQKQGW